MSVNTLDELEAVPIGGTVVINASDRDPEQTWVRNERGLELNNITAPLQSFVGAIAEGRVNPTGEAATPRPDHGFRVDQRIAVDRFPDLPVGTKVRGNGDERSRTITGVGGYYVFDDEPGSDARSHRHDAGNFTITSLPVAGGVDGAALAAAVEDWFTRRAGYYLDEAVQESLREVLREHGVDAQRAERTVNVVIDIGGWTEVNGENTEFAAAILPNVDTIEDVEDRATIRWEHSLTAEVQSRHENPCEDRDLINDQWVTDALNAAGIRFTGFAIEERSCDAC